MSQIHTLVVQYPEGAAPKYSVSTEIYGGRLMAVHFGGDRIHVADQLEVALEDAAHALTDSGSHPELLARIDSVLAQARGETQ